MDLLGGGEGAHPLPGQGVCAIFHKAKNIRGKMRYCTQYTCTTWRLFCQIVKILLLLYVNGRAAHMTTQLKSLDTRAGRAAPPPYQIMLDPSLKTHLSLGRFLSDCLYGYREICLAKWILPM